MKDTAIMKTKHPKPASERAHGHVTVELAANERPAASSTVIDADAGLAAYIQTLHLPRYREIPGIELYMDQVLTYVDDRLRPLFPAHEKLLTSSMVNNYVKQKIIPAPAHKRYGREHVALLISICLMKRAVGVADIKRLLAMQAAAYSTERAYDFFCTAMEESLRTLFCGAAHSCALSDLEIDQPSGVSFSLHIAHTDAINPERHLMVAAATAIANNIYIEKCLERAGEA